jgi:hypothetical protein
LGGERFAPAIARFEVRVGDLAIGNHGHGGFCQARRVGDTIMAGRDAADSSQQRQA